MLESDACRDWRVEHTEWKIEALQAFLRSRPRAAQDETIFEVLQREAYLTSCDPDLRATRSEMIGWRLVGRSLDEYPVVLTESVLGASGCQSLQDDGHFLRFQSFDLGLDLVVPLAGHRNGFHSGNS